MFPVVNNTRASLHPQHTPPLREKRGDWIAARNRAVDRKFKQAFLFLTQPDTLKEQRSTALVQCDLGVLQKHW